MVALVSCIFYPLAANLEEIDFGIRQLEEAGVTNIWLHCTLCYQLDFLAANLAALGDISAHFWICPGLSDHTIGDLTPARHHVRCRVVEKHFTIDKTPDGADHWLSVDENELHSIVTKMNSTTKPSVTVTKPCRM